MNIFILTEGGKDIGFGHITRCVSLYQAFEEIGMPPKLIINGDDTILGLLKGKNYKVLNWLKEKSGLLELIEEADAIIIDSYLADKSLYNKFLGRSKKLLVMIDDYKRIEYPDGIVVNPSIYGDMIDYPKRDSVVYLLGKDYIILRSEFIDVPSKPINEGIKNVLITFGGFGCNGLVSQIIDCVKKNFNFTFNIVYKDKKWVDARQMRDFMLKADICISGGGQTTYELAQVGVPTIGICLSENQRMNLETWHKIGFIEYVGWYNSTEVFKKLIIAIEKLSSRDIRVKMSEIGRNSIDGQGRRRVIGKVLENYETED